jgi:hypothetical protein
MRFNMLIILPTDEELRADVIANVADILADLEEGSFDVEDALVVRTDDDLARQMLEDAIKPVAEG